MSEQQIQKDILSYLRTKGFIAFKFNNYGMRGRKTYNVGISDIIGCDKNGKFIAIEVKKIGGKATQGQLDFLMDVNDHNGIGILAFSLSDVVDYFETRKEK